jgi:hypothetical protein
VRESGRTMAFGYSVHQSIAWLARCHIYCNGPWLRGSRGACFLHCGVRTDQVWCVPSSDGHPVVGKGNGYRCQHLCRRERRVLCYSASVSDFAFPREADAGGWVSGDEISIRYDKRSLMNDRYALNVHIVQFEDFSVSLEIE